MNQAGKNYRGLEVELEAGSGCGFACWNMTGDLEFALRAPKTAAGFQA